MCSLSYCVTPKNREKEVEMPRKAKKAAKGKKGKKGKVTIAPVPGNYPALK
jgi:hypothetical protein